VALNQFIFGLIVAALFNLTPHTSSLSIPPIAQPAKTVQISLDVDADVLIEDSTHQRIGVDLKTRKFVNEIAGARTIDREGSSTFVLPFDKSGTPYTVTVAGKSNTSANLSMTGPGFVVGARNLNLTSGEIEIVTISSTAVSIVQSRNGPTPQVFLTSQSDRSKPSYRFEVIAGSLSRGQTMSVELNLNAGRLNLKSTDTRKGSLTITMRRTNPNGTRDTFSHRDVSFDGGYSYAMDFGSWDGKGDISFCRRISSDEGRCNLLKNEAPANQPN
jgi:Holliday junction resolvase-like predicted endonuclease